MVEGLATAITSGTSILNSGLDFIIGSPILFGIVAMSVVATAITKVKRLFR